MLCARASQHLSNSGVQTLLLALTLESQFVCVMDPIPWFCMCRVSAVLVSQLCSDDAFSVSVSAHGLHSEASLTRGSAASDGSASLHRDAAAEAPLLLACTDLFCVCAGRCRSCCTCVERSDYGVVQ